MANGASWSLRGFPLDELAEHATFEETIWLLWHGELPDAGGARRFRAALAAQRALAGVDASRCCATAPHARRRSDGRAPHGGRHACRSASAEATAIVARVPDDRRRLLPAAPAAASRSRRAPTSATRRTTSTCSPARCRAERVRGLETYLNTVVDHGLNASTFTARVITSTGSDLVSAVVGAIGALKGPLHGGAPGPALDMVFEIGDASRAEAVLRAEDRSGREAHGLRPPRLQGPRPARRRPRAAAERLFTRAGDMSLYDAGTRGRSGRRSACSRSTSPGGGSRPTSSSTPRCSSTASASTCRSSRRPSPSAGSAAGSPTPSSSGARTASSGRNPNTPARAAGAGCPCPVAAPAPDLRASAPKLNLPLCPAERIRRRPASIHFAAARAIGHNHPFNRRHS